MVAQIVKKLPYIRQFFAERDQLRQDVEVLRHQYQTWVPPGHFFSPIASVPEIQSREEEIFSRTRKDILGIALNENKQLQLLDLLQPYIAEMPFQPSKAASLRYHFENFSYSYSDAIFYYCLIRHLKPRRIIEVGSGYSSCVALDTNELFFENKIEVTFIEPYPDLLLSLLKPGDLDRVDLLDKKLEEVDLDIFQQLAADDILFIDSTHVSKVGSDVNRIFFEILPRLASGVHVHFHDVFYPFEYLKEWIYEGRAWNEAYLLRAFLQYNTQFSIVLFNTFLEIFHEDIIRANFPLCMRNLGGSIWIKKV